MEAERLTENIRGEQFEGASKFISGGRTEAEHIAYRSLRAVQLDLKKLGYQLDRVGLLLASGKPLPELEKILQSHALIHAADGELFRQALLRASTRCGLQIICTKERVLLEQCMEAFSLRPHGTTTAGHGTKPVVWFPVVAG